MRRWLIRCSLLLLAVALALLWLLPRLAEKLLRRELQRRGLPVAMLKVQRLTPWQMVLGPVSIGTGAAPQAQTIAVSYSPCTLWAGYLAAVTITGLEATVVLEKGKWWVTGLPQTTGNGTSAAAAAFPEQVRIPLGQLDLDHGLLHVVTGGRAVAMPLSGRLTLAEGKLQFEAELQPRDESIHVTGEFTGVTPDRSLNWRTLTGHAEIHGNLHPNRWQDGIPLQYANLPVSQTALSLAVAVDFKQGLPSLKGTVRNKPTSGLLRLQAPAGQAGLKTFKLDFTLPPGGKELQGTLDVDLQQVQAGSMNLVAAEDEALFSSLIEFKLDLAAFSLQGNGSYSLSPEAVHGLWPALSVEWRKDPARPNAREPFPAGPITGTFFGVFNDRKEFRSRIKLHVVPFRFLQPELDLAGEVSAVVDFKRSDNGALNCFGRINVANLTGISKDGHFSLSVLQFAPVADWDGRTLTGSGEYKLANLVGTAGAATFSVEERAHLSDLAMQQGIGLPGGTFSGQYQPGAADGKDFEVKVTLPEIIPFRFHHPELDLAGDVSAVVELHRDTGGMVKGTGDIKAEKLTGTVHGARFSLADLTLAAAVEQDGNGKRTVSGSGEYKLVDLAGALGPATFAFAESATSPDAAKPDTGTFSGSFKPGANDGNEYQARLTLPVVPFRIKQPELDLNGKVSAVVAFDGSTTGPLKGRGEVKLANLAGTAQGTKLSVAEFAMATDLTAAGNAGSVAETIRAAAVNGRCRFSGGDFLCPAAGITVGGVAGGLPFNWSAKDGFAAVVPEANADDASLSFKQCEGYGFRLKPAQFPLRWVGGRLTLAGTLAADNVPLTVTLNPASVGWRNGLELTAEAEVPRFHLTSDFPLLKERLAAVKGLSIAADVGGKATVDYRQNKLQAKAVAEIANGTVSLAEKKTEISGISGTIELPALPELRTAPHQKLAFAAALLGGLLVDGGSLEYQVESPTALFIDQATLNWCGGLLRGYAVHVNPQRGDFDLTLYAEKIQMERLLGLFRSVQGKATGNLYGRLPVSFKGGKFKFQNGFLYAEPGQAGTLALTQPGWLTASLGKSGADQKTVKQVESALSDMEFSQFRIDFEGEGGGDSLLRLKIIGASRKDRLLPPVDLNINVRSPLEQLLNLGLRLSQ